MNYTSPNLNRYLLVALVTGAASFQAAANVAAVEYNSMPAVDCVINPYRVVDISSPVPGVIEKLYVERSQQVSAGQVVAELEASVERANVELARYRAGVQSEIGLGQVNVNFDQLRKQRVASLHEKQNISEENAQQIEREVQLSRWKLRQARELLDIRKLELRRAEEQLRLKSIRAPFDGFVLDTFKHRGEYVEEQSILRLAQLDPLVIETIVPMEYFGTISAGMQAEIRPEVLLKENLVGTVTVVDRIGDTASNTFGVKLSLPNPDNRIPAGLKCIVKFLAKPAQSMAADNELEDAPMATTGTVDGSAMPRAAADYLADEADPGIDGAPALLASLEVGDGILSPPVDPLEADLGRNEVAALRPAPPDRRDDVDRPSATQTTPSSYMVLMEQPDTAEAARGLVDSLRGAGVRDLLKIDHGVNRGTISLGVFSSRAYATERQRYLENLGFSSYIVERFQ